MTAVASSGERWVEQAECRKPDVDPEWFFPASENTVEYTVLALRVCSVCSVRRECLSWTLESDRQLAQSQIYGIQAGLLAKERRQFSKSARQKRSV